MQYDIGNPRQLQKPKKTIRYGKYLQLGEHFDWPGQVGFNWDEIQRWLFNWHDIRMWNSIGRKAKVDYIVPAALKLKVIIVPAAWERAGYAQSKTCCPEEQTF